jgi:FkbM family methyltransferase
MLFEGMYQEDVLRTLLEVVREGDIVYDVGGHHGLMTVIAARAAGKTGKVVTFEPNPDARKHIESHLSLNRLTNVTIEDMALSDRTGECSFYAQEGVVTWNSTIEKEFAAPESKCMRITTTTLDNYVDRSKLAPHVIKIDTEGSEFKVLKGAARTIMQTKPVLIVEFNPASAHAVGEVLSTYQEFLEKQGYALFVLRRSVFGYYDFAQREPFNEAVHTRGGKLANVVCIQKSTQAA